MLDDDPAETMRRVVENLEGHYGRRRAPRGRDAMDELIATILSQQNSSQSTEAVFRTLKTRFPRWDEARAANVNEIEEAIRAGGLSKQKSVRIKKLLESVHAERGDFDLSFLKRRSADDACAYLMRFDGVGPKTARCTLLFTFAMPVFPMDVHIFRIVERLGLLTPNTPDEAAHRTITALVPKGKHYAAHVLLIEHGRKVCRPTKPRCNECCLIEYCPDGHQRLADAAHLDPRL